MKTKISIYDRIPEMATPQLRRMARFWAGMVESRPTPKRHDYHGKCLLCAVLELEKRAQTISPPLLDTQE